LQIFIPGIHKGEERHHHQGWLDQYPLAEWDVDDREANGKWYEYLISINDGIREARRRLQEEGEQWVELDKDILN